MNCQIVLCPGINDDVELLSTLNDLKKLYPAVSSIAIVPVGLTRFRENLFPLTLFNYEKACKTISTIEEFGNCCKEEFGTRLAYPADEFYIIARKSIPNIDFYEELNQLENGVGLISLLNDEFLWAINDVTPVKPKHKKISVATGIAAFDFIDNLLSLARKKYNIDITVFPIKNIFFGENITVSGLITGNDIIKQLKNKDLGEKLLLPRNMLRSQKDVFLDDTTVEDIKKKLNLPVEIVENSGEAFLYSILGMEV
jgi:putative radical SAM enzyme (TIGR03279 family)